MDLIGLLLIAYLMGAIPFSYLIVKLLTHQDLRHHFSGNAGATNAGRVLKQYGSVSIQKQASKITKFIFLLDVLKGTGAVLLLQAFQVSLTWMLMGGVAAIIGHIFPVFLKFKGGKGVATSLGMLLGILPLVALLSFVIWLIVYLFSGYVSLGSVIAALSAPVIFYFLDSQNFSENPLVSGTLIILSALIVIKHRSNLLRIIKGTETKRGHTST